MRQLPPPLRVLSPLPGDADALLFAHLEALLPLRNPSGDLDQNAVIRYARAALASAGRQVTADSQGNLYAPPLRSLPPGYPLRAIVAHTDSVSQEGGADEEAFTFDGITYRSRRLRRPLGGDDKCGVAVALTLAALMPDIAVVLPADEEIGLVGAMAMDLPRHDLMVECDRRHELQLVCAMLDASEQPVYVASVAAVQEAVRLLPWREPVAGGGTDIAAFVARGLANNAFNLSVGYYEPHTPGEYIVAAAVAGALHDAALLLQHLPTDLPTAPGLLPEDDAF